MRTSQASSSSRPSHTRRTGRFLLLSLPIVLLLGLLFSFMRPLWNRSDVSHQVASSVRALSAMSEEGNPAAMPGHAVTPTPTSATTPTPASTSTTTSTPANQVNIPHYAGSLNVPCTNVTAPFNQTAIFWFGSVSSSSDYVDVRVAYSDSYLFISLNIIDRYVWYDSHASSPNLSIGDTATLYLDSNPGGSGAPQKTAYKFLAQVDNGQPRANYQRAYQGNGSGWSVSSTAFTTCSGWRGTTINGGDDAGWSMTYEIPFSSLGRSAAPAQGNAWRLALAIQNQDNASANPLAVTWWPQSAQGTTSTSWGQLVYGLPVYQPSQTTGTTTYTIRNGVNNQVVTDGMVGGGLGCYGLNQGSFRWTYWATKNWAGSTRTDIANQSDVSDWECFTKYYITIPLSSLPHGKGVVSAKITLYETGNMGQNGLPGPNPSNIEVATVNQAWSASTIDWNNAPPVGEIISMTTVNLYVQAPLPGNAYTWDVSAAVAKAYASGQPLRLVFYSTGALRHSGKYFTTSYQPSWDIEGRPALQVTLG